MRRSVVFSILLLILFTAALAKSQSTGVLSGRVRFPDGTPLANAVVEIALPNDAAPMQVRSDSRGAFRAEVPAGLHELRVVHQDALSARESVDVPAGGEARVELVVAAARHRETITVTAALDPRPSASVPSSIVVLEGERVRDSPGVTLDDALRSVPGFSLFRRTSSMAAHPTAQGLSLRGVGPSGTSRSLVVADGFPINDPFGGWVYWNRVPKEAIASVEVLRGTASSLYGNSALSGVANVLSERPSHNMLRASLAGGETGIVDGSWLAGFRFARKWGLTLDGQAFRNDGYFVIPEERRGAADAPAALEFVSSRVRLERELANGGWVHGSAGFLTEDRENGTRVQVNSTDLRYVSLAFDAPIGHAGGLRGGLQYLGETFRSTFSSITADRSRETLTLRQRVPADAVTARLEWSGAVASHHLAVGGDTRWVEGTSHEASATRVSAFGGRQWVAGIFAQDVFSITPRLQLSISARGDRWSTTDRSTGAVSNSTVFNPHAGLRFQATGVFALRAQAYRGFRAPTLNELYRQFQVGNIVTRANPALRPERTNGGEAGFDLSAGASVLRVTGFWTELRDPVSNVTLTPNGLLRERQNVGRARIRGLEADWEWQPRRDLELRAGYLFSDATVRKFDPDPRLLGLRLPQVPRHQGTLAVQARTWRNSLVRVETRLAGVQFDDDRNLLPLAGYAEVGAAFSIPVNDRVVWFLHAQNLLDRRYPVARTPVISVSAPRIVQAGVRFTLFRR